jgi:hypothetical protein
VNEPLCWYCGRRAAQDRFLHRVPLTRGRYDVELVIATITRAEAIDVFVPRCASCWRANLVYAYYRRMAKWGAMAACIAVLVAVVTWMQYDDLYTFWSPGYTFALVVLGLVGAVLGPARLFIKLRPRRPPAGYPPIADLIAQGWSVGSLSEGFWNDY